MSDYPIIREVVCINCEEKFILEEGEEEREFCCDSVGGHIGMMVLLMKILIM